MYILIILIFFAIYCYYYIKSFTFWTQRNVKQASKWTAIKENLQTTIRKLTFMDLHLRNYRRHAKSSRYIGFYQFGRPTLMIRDPELIKQITVKNRDQFLNRQTITVEGNDPFWESTIFALRGEKWHTVRSTLSPAFTSNKIKAMFVLVDESAQEFTRYLLKNSKQEIYQCKELFRRFGANVIANCAFGHKCNSLEERDNDFYKYGIKIANFFNFWMFIKLLISRLSKKLARFLNFKQIDSTVSAFFLDIVQGQIKVRQENNIVRPDMLELLIQARKEASLDSTANMKFTDVEITSQAMSFFAAGFDTIATSLSFTCHEMALHPEIQERLREEINQTLQGCNGKLTYDALNGMKYMDMVISESLRKWPPAIFADRLLKGKYTIEKSPLHPNELEDLVLDDNSSLWIPIYPMHNDPEFFPEPEVFNPERFSDENKKNIKPYSYLPFGVGPRACIGMRFALIEMKIALFHILHQFEIVPNAKTQIPLKIGKGLFNLDSTDGIWLSFKRLH